MIECEVCHLHEGDRVESVTGMEICSCCAAHIYKVRTGKVIRNARKECKEIDTTWKETR